MTTKICKRCGKELPYENFYNNKHMRDGKYNACKACILKYNRARDAKPGMRKARLAALCKRYLACKDTQAAYYRAYYIANKEKIRARNLKYYYANKEKMDKKSLEYYHRTKQLKK